MKSHIKALSGIVGEKSVTESAIAMAFSIPLAVVALYLFVQALIGLQFGFALLWLMVTVGAGVLFALHYEFAVGW